MLIISPVDKVKRKMNLVNTNSVVLGLMERGMEFVGNPVYMMISIMH